jgi:hypothetical protein
MDLPPSDRQPSREGAVELGDRIEPAGSQHMVADDVDLPFDPTLRSVYLAVDNPKGDPSLGHVRGSGVRSGLRVILGWTLCGDGGDGHLRVCGAWVGDLG